MSGRWWRAYDEAVDDPKLQRLSADIFRAWFNLMCLASQGGGFLPAIDDIAFKLRMKLPRAEAAIAALRQNGLIDEVDGKLQPHNWEGRQFQSDVSTERVKRFRKQHGNVSSAVSGTPPETETETEKKDVTGKRPVSPTKYAFEVGIIRLSRKDFDAWTAAFSNLNLRAELTALAEWAGRAEQKAKWFHAVAGALAKRDREALRTTEAAKSAAAGPLPSDHPDKWREALL